MLLLSQLAYNRYRGAARKNSVVRQVADRFISSRIQDVTADYWTCPYSEVTTNDNHTILPVCTGAH